jgi:hypothetical protein
MTVGYESRVTFKLPGGAHADARVVHARGAEDHEVVALASREFSERFGFEPVRFAEGYTIDGLRVVSGPEGPSDGPAGVR